MEALTKTDVVILRNDIVNKLVPSLRGRRADLLKQGDDALLIKALAQKSKMLLDLAEDLNNQVAVELLTDIKEPGKEIQTAIHNLSDAINKIEKVNQFFEKLAVAIDILQTLVSAVGSGNPAKISVILNKLTV